MSNQNKFLFLAVAVVAFIIGAAINTARVKPMAEVNELLNAKLLTADETMQTVKQHLGKVTLVNFWASWCTPCRREMPLFQAIYEREKASGFQIVGIAIDDPGVAETMLDSMGISYPNLYAEQTGMELMELSGNPVGAMPYSLLLDSEGNIIDQKLGEIHEPQLQAWSQGKAFQEN